MLPNRDIVVINLAAGARDINYALGLINKYLPNGYYEDRKVDLIISDNSFNDLRLALDEFKSSAELFIRRAKLLNITTLMIGSNWLKEYEEGYTEYSQSLQILSAYYNASMIDVRIGMDPYITAIRNVEKNISKLYFGEDHVHWTWRYHEIFAQYIFHYLVLKSQGTCNKRNEVHVGIKRLPPPLYNPANIVDLLLRPCQTLMASTLSIEDSMPPYIEGTSCDGTDWEYISDVPTNYRKVGWISRKVGSCIQFQLESCRGSRIYLTVLRSYEGVGIASIEVLESGCEGKHLAQLTADTLWKERVSVGSVVKMTYLPTNCSKLLVRLTVLDRPVVPGEVVTNKIKLLSISSI